MLLFQQPSDPILLQPLYRMNILISDISGILAVQHLSLRVNRKAL